MRNSKRGSYLVEASIVLPIVIMTMITLVLIIMFFYSQISESSKMHIHLRSVAGSVTEKTIYMDKSQWNGNIHIDRSFLGGTVSGEGNINMSNNGLLREPGSYVRVSKAFATDGVKYVRYCNNLNDAKCHEKQ